MAQTSESGNKAQAQAKPPFKSVNGGFVAITVPDLDASAKWYVEKLGLKVVKNHAMRPDGKAAVTILQGNGFSVELIWLADASPLSKVAPQVKGPQEIHGILKSGIFVDDLDAALKELKSRNVTMAFDTFYDKSMDCRMFAIRDNNGNILQFFGK
jgi:catechol 2,3-dioxygenase-like lactoylglutathione lyase family enzyme